MNLTRREFTSIAAAFSFWSEAGRECTAHEGDGPLTDDEVETLLLRIAPRPAEESECDLCWAYHLWGMVDGETVVTHRCPACGCDYPESEAARKRRVGEVRREDDSTPPQPDAHRHVRRLLRRIWADSTSLFESDPLSEAIIEEVCETVGEDDMGGQRSMLALISDISLFSLHINRPANYEALMRAIEGDELNNAAAAH